MDMRVLVLAVFSLALAGGAVAKPDTYISAEGVEYYAPTSDGWTFSPMSNIVRLAEVEPRYREQLADALPDMDLGGQRKRIYLVEKNAVSEPVGQISFSLDSVPAVDAITQKEMRAELAADPRLRRQLIDMLNLELATVARGMEQTDLYLKVQPIRNDLTIYGRWICFTMLFDTKMSTGEEPYYLSIACPAGTASLNFTVFFEPKHSDEVTSMAAKMVASVDVSRAKWEGASDQ